MSKTGFVLSGGGVRGIAHLGVIKALNEFGIYPSMISGTSAGSIVGAFVASGHTPDEILHLAKHAGIFSFSNILFHKQGLFNMNAFEELYLKHIPHNSFEQLNIPLHVTATDIVKGETVYFNKGELSKTLMASSCVPVVFEPISYDGKLLLDGGILNNLPVEPILGKCDKVIGIHVNSISRNREHLHMKDLVDRSFHLALSNSVRLKEQDCDLFIEPPEMTRFGMFDLSKADEIFECGYNYAMQMRKEIELFEEMK